MGFLRKDWDYENPAEHDMEQPAEEQKDRKLWLWGLALICGGLAVYALYHIENTIYGGAINTSWAGWAGTFTGFLIVACFGDFLKPKKEVEHKWGKGEKIVGWILCTVVIIGLFAACWKMPRLRIYGFQFLSILPVAFGLDKVRKAGASENTINAWNFMLTALLLAVTTLAAPRILGICTVAEAEGKLAAEGYYVEKYEYAVASWLVDHFVPSATVELDDDPWDDMYYLFDLGNQNAVVDPRTREIIAE